MSGRPHSSPEEQAPARRHTRAERTATAPAARVELTGATLTRAVDALREGFTLDSLRTLFVTELSVTLDDVVATAGRPFQEICRDAVQWALDSQAVGLAGLIAAAARANGSDRALAGLAAEWAGAEFVLPPCPYPGMVPFTEKEVGAFFGRDTEIERALQALRLHPFLAIIGASGSGKSSLAFAGIVPAMRKATGFGKSKLELIELRPGATPLATLAAALGVEFNPPPPPAAPAEMVALYARPYVEAARRHAPLVLLIDQAEEMFNPDATGADDFARVLLALVGLERVWVMITVRADFYPQLFESPLWEQIEAHRLEVGALRGEGLRAAIAGPARLAGVSVDPALVERLLADAAGEPGALPFIQETMVLLWERAARLRLTLEDYQAIVAGSEGMSGLQVAMARRADQTYNGLWEAARPLAQRTFIRLIQFGEGRPNTRRRQPVARLVEPGEDRALFDRTLQTLADHRLLTLSAPDPSAAGGNGAEPDRNVDISHEALLTGWPRLRDWITEHRDAEIQRRRFETKADNWKDFGQGDTGLLDVGELAAVDAWLASSAAAEVGASDLLRALVARSRAHLADLARAEEEARRRELAQQRALAEAAEARAKEEEKARHAATRAGNLFRILTAALTIFLVAAGVAIWYIVDQAAEIEARRQAEATARAEAEEQRAEAEVQRENADIQRANAEEQQAIAEEQTLEAVAQRNQAWTAESRRLATLAQEQLPVDAVASIHLAAAALPGAEPDRPYVPEAELALQQAVFNVREHAFVAVDFEDVDRVAVGEGRVAVARAERVDLYDGDLQPTGSLPLAGVVGLRWGGDGRLLAWTRDEASIWRGPSRTATLPVDGSASPIYCAEWQPQQEWVAVCTEAALAVVNVAEGTAITAPFSLPPEENPDAITFAPRVYGAEWSADGRRLAGRGPRLYVWDSTTPDAAPRELPRATDEAGDYWNFARWSPAGVLASSIGSGADLHLWQPPAAPYTVTLFAAADDALWVVGQGGEEQVVLSEGGWWPQAVDAAGRSVEQVGNVATDSAADTRYWLLQTADGLPLVRSESDLRYFEAVDDSDPARFNLAQPQAAAARYQWLAVGHAGGLSIVNLLQPSLPPTPLSGSAPFGTPQAVIWNADGRLYSLDAPEPGPDGVRRGALRLWQPGHNVTVDQATAGDLTLQPPRAGAPPSCTPLGVGYAQDRNFGFGTAIGWAGGAAFAADPVGRLVRWEPESGAQAVLAPARGADYGALLWSPDGTGALRLRRGSADAGAASETTAVLELYTLDGGRWRTTHEVALDVTSAAWFSSGILATHPERATWWMNPATGEAAQVLDVGVNGASELGDGSVALAALDGKVHLLDARSLSITQSYTPGGGANVLAAAATRDGTRLLFSVQYAGIELWPRDGSEPLWRYDFADSLSLEFGTPVALHPEGRAVAVLDGGELVLLDGADGAVLQRITTAGAVTGVQWSADGTRLLASAQDALQLWRWEGAQGRLDLVYSIAQADGGAPLREVLSAQGDQLLALDPTGMALVRWRVWRDYRDLARDAQECFVTHELTEEQKRQFVLD